MRQASKRLRSRRQKGRKCLVPLAAWVNLLLGIFQRAATGKSWYKNDDGRITNNWSGSTIRYWWKTRSADLSLYRRKARVSEAEPAAETFGSGAHMAAD
jgi:hypothetical protein